MIFAILAHGRFLPIETSLGHFDGKGSHEKWTMTAYPCCFTGQSHFFFFFWGEGYNTSRFSGQSEVQLRDAGGRRCGGHLDDVS